MAYLPRGIAPELLISQVKNTMPYLFGPEVGEHPLGGFPGAEILRGYEAGIPEPLPHLDYFKLCVSSHYLTCATPVPTDVDNQIRHKLWPEALPLETALEMADFALSTHKWDFTQVTGRFSCGASGTPFEKEPISGHQGEWFTIASGAYCGLKQYAADPLAQSKRAELFEAISNEVNRHSELFGSLWRAGDGIGCLKASAALAHNFGDLDRVMDMWKLGIEDPLRLRFYNLGITPFDPDKKLRYLGRLWTAGELYKSQIDGSSMAQENHRHFALRKPKCLRSSRALLIPTGPFFDAWGRAVAETLSADETLEVMEALKHGWDRLGKAMGYGRALRGILEVRPEMPQKFTDELLKVHAHRAVMETPQDRFEKKWNEAALKELDDIPSRA